MSEWKEYKLIDLASNVKNSFIDGDWIESPHIKGTGIRLIQTGNIGKGFFRDSNKKYISEESFQRLNCKEVKPGDVLICRLADPIGRSCKVPDLKTKNITSVDVTIFKIDQYRFDENFVLQLINTDEFLSKATEVAGGSTRQRISRNNLANLRVRIPEFLAEQQKIASIFMACDAVIEKTQTAIEKYKAIKQGMLHDLFTRGIDVTTGKLRPKYEAAPELYKESRLGMVPQTWEVDEIINLSKDGLKNGYFKKPEYVGQGYKLINVIDLYQPFGIDINKDSVERVFVTLSDYSKYEVEVGDIFFTRSSLVLEGIAHCNIILTLPEQAVWECHVVKLSPNNQKINPEFLGYYCTTYQARLFFMSIAKQVTMTTISQPDISKLLVPYPISIKEQAEISKRLKTIEQNIYKEQTYLQKLQQIKAGLMNDLLSGKKRVKLPEEEEINA